MKLSRRAPATVNERRNLLPSAHATNQTTILKDLKFTGFLFESMVVHDLRVYAQANDAKLQHYRAPKSINMITDTGISYT